MKIKKKVLILIILILTAGGIIFGVGKIAKSNTQIAKALGIKKYSEVAEEISPESISLGEGNTLVKLGKDIQLNAEISPENVNINNGLTWESSDTQIAEVDQNGLVKGNKIGSATITVTTDNGISTTKTVVVGPDNNYIDIKNRPLKTFAKGIVPTVKWKDNEKYITYQLKANVIQNFMIDKENQNIYFTQDRGGNWGLVLTKIGYDYQNEDVEPKTLIKTMPEILSDGKKYNAGYMFLKDFSRGEFIEYEYDERESNEDDRFKIWLQSQEEDDKPIGISRIKDFTTYDYKNVHSYTEKNTDDEKENWVTGAGYNNFAIYEDENGIQENDLIAFEKGDSDKGIRTYKVYKLEEWKTDSSSAIPITEITHDIKFTKDIFKNSNFTEEEKESFVGGEGENKKYKDAKVKSEPQGFDIDGSYIYMLECAITSDANIGETITTFKNKLGKSNVLASASGNTYYGDTYISVYDLAGNPICYRRNMEESMYSEIEKEGKKSLEDLDFYSEFLKKEGNQDLDGDGITNEDIYERYQGQGIKVYDGQLYTGYSLAKTEGDKNQNILYLAEKKVIGMTIKENPTKMIYTIGEKLDTTGMKLLVEYEYGEDQEVTEGFTCTPIEFNTAGKQEITVEYEGKTATFEVEVEKKTINSTGIINKLKSEVYLYDSEAKSITIPETEEWPEGLLNITPTYIKGINLDGEEVEKPIEVGTYIVKLNFEVEENYEIISTQYRCLDIFDIPKNLKGTVGDKLETIEFKDGEKEYPGLEWNNPTEVFSLDKENYKAIYTPENENFDGISVEIDIPVTVINPIIGIELPEDLKKDYILGEELENFEGKKIKVIYKNGDMQEIDMISEEVQITGHNKELWEKQAITVTYDGFSVNYEIRNRKNVSITNLIKNEVHIYEKGLEQWITIPGQENWPEGISNITKKLGPNSVAKGKPEEPGIYDINIEFEVVDEDKYVKPPVITVYLEIFEIPTDIKGNDGQKLEDIGLPDRFKWEDGNQTLNLEQEKYLATYTSYVDINSTLITKEIEIPVKILSTITWINEDGTVLEIDDNVEAGIIPSYDGEIPKKAADIQYVYVFVGWEPVMTEVVGNTTYTAKYQKIEKPKGLTAIYGEKLSDVELPEGFSWEAEEGTLVGNVGENGFTVKYTPSDQNYEEVIGIPVKVVVGKATPEVEVPTGIEGKEGQKLEEIELPDGFEWKNPETVLEKPEEGDPVKYPVIYRPEDTDNYNEVELEVPVTIYKNIVDMSQVIFRDKILIYDGKEHWVEIQGELPVGIKSVSYEGNVQINAGEYTVIAKFEVEEGYNAVEDLKATLIILKAVPVYKISTSLTAIYGEKLSDVELPERFSWKESTDTSVGPVGENDFTLIYTPEDTDNYKVVEIPVKVVVEKAEPTFEVPTGIEGKEGQKLEEIELPDGFEWKNPETILEKPEEGNTEKYPVIYSPEDTDNYNKVELEIPVSIKIIELAEIQIKSNPNKTEYIIGESLDLEGLSVIAKYSDDSEINITDRFINQTGILNEVGEQEITLEYEGKTASFTINVVERLEVNIEGYEEYIEDNDKYIKVKPYTTLEELLKGIKANEGATVTVFKDLETIADYTQKVETKMRVEITLGTQKITYTTILMGDVNGDGKADLQDMIKINTFRLFGTPMNPEWIYEMAADVNEDDKKDLQDMIKINTFRLFGTRF